MKLFNNRFWTCAYRYILDLENFYPSNYSQSNCFRFCPLNKKLLEQMIEKYQEEISEYKVALLRKRLNPDSTDKTYVLLNEEKDIYGFYHIAFGINFDTCVHVTVESDDENVHFFDDYTFRVHRKEGAHSFSIYSRLILAKNMGYHTASVHIMRGNIASELAYSKYGFIKNKGYLYFKGPVVSKTARWKV